jgi:hypothetical protein
MKIYLAQIYLSITKKEIDNYIVNTNKIPSVLESYFYIKKQIMYVTDKIKDVQG